MESEDSCNQKADRYGTSYYNPPDFVLNATREALLCVECNKYAPTMVLKVPNMHVTYRYTDEYYTGSSSTIEYARRYALGFILVKAQPSDGDQNTNLLEQIKIFRPIRYVN